MKENIILKEFLDTLVSELSKRYPENVVTINEVNKNNGLVLYGLSIREEGTNISPTIYMNDLYVDFTNGKSMDAIANQVSEVYEGHRVESVDMNFFMNFETVKEHICYKLINTERNADFLETTPHIAYNDLSIVFFCKIRNPEFGDASISIFDNHMEMWGVKTEDLMKAAEVNTPKLMPLELKNMEQVMNEMFSCEIKEDFVKSVSESMNENFGIEPPDEYFEDMINEIMCSMHESDVPMYVMTNSDKTYGAASMLYPHALEDFAAACGGDFYLLPSSVHETILVPKMGNNLVRLNEMVKEVNETQVSREEVLADHAYFYDAAKKELINNESSAKVEESEKTYDTDKQPRKEPAR